MYPQSDDIVLEAIDDEQAVPLRTEDRYYDSKISFLKPAGRDSNALTFDIDAMITRYTTHPKEMMQITLPAMVFTRTPKARGSKKPESIHLPALWEMGGLNKGSFGRPSWCAIIGDSAGERINRHDVCQVRYPTNDRGFHPSGRHALVAVRAETMFVVAQKNHTATTALFYKLDDILEWPKAFLPEVALPKDRAYVALNCSLVGIRQLKDDTTRGWADKNRLTEVEQQGIARLFRLTQGKLAVASYSACNIELFWTAAANSAERNTHEAPPDSDIIDYTVEPDCFVEEVIRHINEYRFQLSNSTLKINSHPIPASVHYERNDDDTIAISVEVPNALDNSHFSISTTLVDEIPTSLLNETTLANGNLSFDEMITGLEVGQPMSLNIFTFC